MESTSISVYYSKLAEEQEKRKTSENWEHGSVCDIKTQAANAALSTIQQQIWSPRYSTIKAGVKVHFVIARGYTHHLPQ